MKKNVFSTDFLDKAYLKRSDEKWLNTQLQTDSSLIIPVYNSNVLCSSVEKPEAVFLSRATLETLSYTVKSPVFLGIKDAVPFFAVNVESAETAKLLNHKTGGQFLDLKSILPFINFKDQTLLSIAKFMIDWRINNSFCGKCGTVTKSEEAGNLLICQNHLCKNKIFPSMDPAIIVLVSRGEYCLLGRQKAWREKFYSTIAGFVEPGETIENAVAREVMEESGIHIKDIEYQNSQPWLFPRSLMLGFTATATSHEIKLGDNELEDAKWFSREEIKSCLKDNSLKLPRKTAISYKLIKDWFEKNNEQL